VCSGVVLHHRYAEVISALQCFTGLIYMAIITGLLYARFTRPLTRLMLSDCICINNSDAAASRLELRIANGHKVCDDSALNC
jgi:inward rectifier potassium channel